MNFLPKILILLFLSLNSSFSICFSSEFKAEGECPVAKSIPTVEERDPNAALTAEIAPSYEEFLKKGMLVHVGSLVVEDDQPMIKSSYTPLTYWSMNSLVPNDTFLRNRRRGVCVVLTPLRTRLSAMVSLCAQEVMLAGACCFQKGDIILIHTRSTQDNYYTPEELAFHQLTAAQRPDYYRELVDFSGLVDISGPSVKKGYRLFYSTQELDLLKKKGVTVIEINSAFDEDFTDVLEINSLQEEVKKILLGKGCWSFSFDEKFWTHRTPFQLGERRITNQGHFFKDLLEKHPKVSLGYEFYSVTNYGSIFRVLHDMAENTKFFEQSPRTYQELKTVLLEFIRDSIEDETLGSKARDVVEEVFARRKVDQEKRGTAGENEADLNAQDQSSFNLSETLVEYLLGLSPTVFDEALKILREIEELEPHLILIEDAYAIAEHHRNNGPDVSMEKRYQLCHHASTSYELLRNLYNACTGYDTVSNPDYSSYVESAIKTETVYNPKISVVEKELDFYTTTYCQLSDQLSKLSLKTLKKDIESIKETLLTLSKDFEGESETMKMIWDFVCHFETNLEGSRTVLNNFNNQGTEATEFVESISSQISESNDDFNHFTMPLRKLLDEKRWALYEEHVHLLSDQRESIEMAFPAHDRETTLLPFFLKKGVSPYKERVKPLE